MIDFFVKNKILLVLITLFFSVGGIFSFFNLKRNEDPGFKIRTASIITDSKNLNAEKTDLYITRSIEKKLLEMEEIEYIKSESATGLSVIYADLYEFYNNIQPIWDRLRRKIALVSLPDKINPVVNDEFADVFGALIGVSKKGAGYEELYDITDNLKDEFLKMKERGKVEIIGEQNEVIYLNFKNSYFTNLKLTPDKIQEVISALNILGGSGSLKQDKNEIPVNSKTEILNEEKLKNTVIDVSKKPIKLGEIFEIEKTTEKPAAKLVRSNGKDALIIAISLKKDGNILKWGKEIQKTVKELQKKYPDVKLEILALQSEYVKNLTGRFISSLLESILSVILIISLTLGLKSGAAIGFMILITIFSTFYFMEIFNIGFDKISLSALIISLGILVDNSIVIIESCKRNNNEKDKTQTIIKTAKKFTLPLFIVTLTASFSFLPVFMAKSAAGEYASNLFPVIFTALFFSWFYSTGLLPIFLLKFNQLTGEKNFVPLIFFKKYIKTLLTHPKIVVISGMGIFLLSLICFNFVPKIFFPDSDRNMFEIRFNLKNGTSLKETKRNVLKIEEFLSKNKDISRYSSYIGTSAPRYVLSATPEADRKNFAMLLVNTKSNKLVDKNISEAKKFINKNLPVLQAVVRRIPLGPPIDAPVEIRIYDNDKDNLFKYAETISRLLSKIKEIYLIKNNWGDLILQYDVYVNQNAALMAGVNPYGVFNFLDTLYNGKILTYYYRGKNRIPVILKGTPKIPSNTVLYSSAGGIVPINQIADIKENFSYGKILRRNNSYVLTVQAWVDKTITSNKICKILKPELDKIHGLNYEFGGEVEKSRKGNKSVTDKIPNAIMLIIFVLVWFFNSIKKPLIIFLCGILALSGANFGLFITGSSFGFITFLGYICLAGISINNGVILMNEISDYKNSKNDLIKEVKNAVVSRIKPILLTALTTIAGMLPLWIKNDPMFSTLAIAITFGLISSVFITLLFMPSVYLLLNLRKN